MKNMYENASSSTQPDELSLFLHQILLCSSSSSSSSAAAASSSSFMPESCYFPPSRPMFVSGEPLSSSCGVTFSDSADYFPGNVSSVGPIDNCNGLDEYDCESEEGHVDLGEEVTVKAVSYRHSSKRTRAAEVHNMSEKRRRSKINEKMKALQRLIPNSNKTDKASMLDEAIEYLKQLQLQVQRLSMRSGRGMRPMCLPGVPQPHHQSQMRMIIHSMNQKIPTQSFPSNLPLIPNTIQIINPETSFGLESSISSRLESVQFHTSHERNREGGVVLKTEQNYMLPMSE